MPGPAVPTASLQSGPSARATAPSAAATAAPLAATIAASGPTRSAGVAEPSTRELAGGRRAVCRHRLSEPRRVHPGLVWRTRGGRAAGLLLAAAQRCVLHLRDVLCDRDRRVHHVPRQLDADGAAQPAATDTAFASPAVCTPCAPTAAVASTRTGVSLAGCASPPESVTATAVTPSPATRAVPSTAKHAASASTVEAASAFATTLARAAVVAAADPSSGAAAARAHRCKIAADLGGSALHPAAQRWGWHAARRPHQLSGQRRGRRRAVLHSPQRPRGRLMLPLSGLRAINSDRRLRPVRIDPRLLVSLATAALRALTALATAASAANPATVTRCVHGAVDYTQLCGVVPARHLRVPLLLPGRNVHARPRKTPPFAWSLR